MQKFSVLVVKPVLLVTFSVRPKAVIVFLVLSNNLCPLFSFFHCQLSVSVLLKVIVCLYMMTFYPVVCMAVCVCVCCLLMLLSVIRSVCDICLLCFCLCMYVNVYSYFVCYSVCVCVYVVYLSCCLSVASLVDCRV
jgi:hypothetical protein